LNDNNTGELDAMFAALDSHPNIGMPLFNPFANRGQRWVSYLSDFSRANRRMHNRSLTADNQFSIVGGRNVGEDYFGAANNLFFCRL
jgi:cardiolipin synthase C